MDPSVSLAAEVRSLQRCINDLVSVLTLPPIWAGAAPEKIVTLLLDTLIGMLDLDFIYARVGSSEGTPIGVLRALPSLATSTNLRPRLDGWFAESPQAWRVTQRVNIDGFDLALLPLRLGLLGEMGVLVAGCRREDFPKQTETLVLTVAANQAAIALQEAKVRNEQVKELERRWHQVEGELRATQGELAYVARVMTLGELTASIAHELNQPLAGIVTNANTCLRMLAADPPNVSGANETTRRTLRDAHRASDVIQRLRALFARKELAPEAVDLNEAAREVLALCSADLERQRVVLRLEFARELPPVAADRVQLQQVILNLIGNASDAMANVHDRPRELTIRTEPEGEDSVRVTVQDTGVGFSPEDADKLFAAFYTTKSGGMGIGLSVSRSIVRSHHGELWATSNAGSGATFAFRIPRERPTPRSQ